MKPARILLVAEAVTLAHFARCVTLARLLTSRGFEVTLASDPRYLSLVPAPYAFNFRRIHSIPSALFAAALAKGRAVYDVQTLVAYVEEDMALLDEVRPDLVIGDFRLSLAVSAPRLRIPYASIINAYWSPYARVRYPVPDLPFVRALGLPVSQRLFDMIRPLAFALHAMPLNRVRRQHGLPALALDLRHAYSWADHVLYPDLAAAIDVAPLPGNHHFIGPLLWSADTDIPAWWSQIPDDKPVVYLSLGSSGDAKLLPMVLETLGRLAVTVIAATAGSIAIPQHPSNTFLADYLPGEAATERADLVICNGGSLTTYQAMRCAAPILGITNNMDQLLNMQMVERLGVGKILRAARFDATQLRETIQFLLTDSGVAAAATRSADELALIDSAHRVSSVVERILR